MGRTQDMNPFIMRALYSFFGIVVQGLALNLFLVGNNIAAGGFSGVAIVFRQYVPLSIGTIVFIMNIPVLLAALIMNGWKYFAGAVVCSMLYSGTLGAFSILPNLTTDPLVAAVFGGVFYGIGMALLTFGNSTCGGTDLLVRLLAKAFPRMSLGALCTLIDGGVVVLAMVAFRNIEVGLYAVITICVCAFACDHILLGFKQGSICIIITAFDACEIAGPLMEALGRGATHLKGTGMYSGLSRNVLLLAARTQEVPKVKRIVQSLDQDAFVMMLGANEIVGGNFSSGIFYGGRI